MFAIGELIAGLETLMEPDAVEHVKRELLRSANELDGGRFGDLRVPTTAFGAGPTGTELGVHHDRAHQVISETIRGVVQDMRDFRQGVVNAEQLLDHADSGAQADLTVQKAAVEQLAEANALFAGDRSYDHARNRFAADGGER